MNKEQEQIIDEVYQNYLTNFIPPNCPSYLDVQPSYYEPMTKEWFVKSIKERGTRGEEFSQKWGLKIEERELSLRERFRLIGYSEKFYFIVEKAIQEQGEEFLKMKLNEAKIPTKVITLTYQNEKIESYE
jgi:hypothetical protein